MFLTRIPVPFLKGIQFVSSDPIALTTAIRKRAGRFFMLLKSCDLSNGFALHDSNGYDSVFYQREIGTI